MTPGLRGKKAFGKETGDNREKKSGTASNCFLWLAEYICSVSNVGNLDGCHRCAKKIGEGGIGDRVEKHIIQVTNERIICVGEHSAITVYVRMHDRCAFFYL